MITVTQGPGARDAAGSWWPQGPGPGVRSRGRGGRRWRLVTPSRAALAVTVTVTRRRHGASLGPGTAGNLPPLGPGLSDSEPRPESLPRQRPGIPSLSGPPAGSAATGLAGAARQVTAPVLLPTQACQVKSSSCRWRHWHNRSSHGPRHSSY